MKVLMICSGLVPGGKERQLIEVVKNLDRERYTLGIITFNTQHHYSEQARENTSYFRELSKRPTRLEPLFSIWKCFREFRPDIVHTWDTISSFYCFLPCKILGIPLIDGSVRDAGIDKGIFYHFKRFFLKRASLVIGNSLAGLKAYRSEGTVIYNAINTGRFLHPSDTREFNLVMTANFSDYKDQATFLKASGFLVKEGIVDNVFLLGHGIHKKKYEDWVQTEYPALKDHFHFPGAVRNVEEYLSNCKVGVLCSTPEFSEGLSNSVLEYMAAGLVPIVTDIGGSAEIVEDGINGFLIRAREDQKIVERVKLLKNDSALREKLGAAAKKTIDEKFSMKKNLLQLTDHYDKLCRRRDGLVVDGGEVSDNETTHPGPPFGKGRGEISL